LSGDDEALVAGLSQAARRVAADEAHAGPAPAAWHRLQQARDGQRGRVKRAPHYATKHATRWRWMTGLAAAVGAAALVGAAARTGRRPLTYVVTGGQVEANGYVWSAGAADTEMRFSDGTRVHLTRGTRMSVGAPGPLGARLRVEDGEAHFEVTHRPGADWSVEAGPYRVQVTGTVFDVRWSGTDEAATVSLRAGSVRVTGPHLTEAITLAAGQRLVATLSSAEVRIEQGATPPPAASRAPITHAPLEAPPPPGNAPAARARPAAPRRPAQPAFAPELWSERVARGESAAVLAEARARSLDEVLAHVDGAALAALADAARYSGERALSERVLLELRGRFPGSRQSPTAAFLMGRMADDGGDTRGALTWYRRYRDEAPRGPYTAEVLGREMLAVERLSGRAAAQTIARDYLGRFPNGTYFLQARAILGLP
jgi:ferric-dicitrate binding protein FerR (iron transport regulator)